MSTTRLEPPTGPLGAIRQFDLRILITGLLIAALCAMFWLGSRYPSLQGKASGDPNEALSAPLGFERFFPEPPPDQTLKHIGWTALEWAQTNRQGMTFGLLLAAGMLTILPLLPHTRGGKVAGAVQGLAIGTPLGVCVNCAAPITDGMLKGGSRVEVALSTLFSSPTFNVIVLGILLSIFPWYLAGLKIATGLVMALVVAPWLARLADRPGWSRPIQAPPRLPGLRVFTWLESLLGTTNLRDTGPAERPKGPFRALVWVLLHYPRNLWRVALVGLPLMLLAGLAGAVLAELLPWSSLAQISHLEGLAANAALLVVVAAFGVLLPVPMAFDVIVCSVLLNAGMPVYLVAALLVTLGIYSIYPWTLLGTTLSWRVAGLAGAAVFALGVTAGGAAGLLDRWHEISQARQTSALAVRPAPKPQPAGVPAGISAADLRGMVRPAAAPRRVIGAAGLEISWAPFEAAGATAAGPRAFTRIEGAVAGFKRLSMPRRYQVMQPGIMHLGALAAGDVNGDGWPDVAVGTDAGVLLYANVGGRFVLQQVDFPAMRDWVIADVALVDLDGDAALDLYFSTWMQGTHVLYNRNGRFSEGARVELPRASETAVAATAFADVDRDGDLDIVTGGASFQSWFFYPQPAVNRLWRNHRGEFTPETLPGPEGDTLSLLFTDLDGDGWPDLLVGNDFDEPDRIFMNERGALRPVRASEAPIPYSTTTTMSFDTGDVDNDGRPELYVGQIAMGRMGDLPKRLAPPVGSCGVYAELADRARCDALVRFQAAVARGRDTWSIGPCKELADPAEQRDCAVTVYHWQRVLVRLPAIGADKATVMAECRKIPADFLTMQDVCAAMAASPMDYNKTHTTLPDELPSMPHTNLLFTPGGQGYRDVTKAWKVGYGGWTWNARFADLDNDTWQDLFIAQGSRLRLRNPSIVLYRNAQGATFEEITRAAGLEDHSPTGASLFVDYDLDGDLDLITYPFQMTPVVWRNDAVKGQAIEVQLDDRRTANRRAVGARVEIRAPDGRRQVREIKASGGYQSHDAPVAWFGLGDWASVASLTVSWPDGESREVSGAALRPGRLTLTRLAR